MLALPRFQDAHPCAYLDDREARMEYQFAVAVSGSEYESLMHQRFRKFGHLLFRPVCITCSECRPLRVRVAEFTPDRSQRRCLSRNADLTVRVGPPVADITRLDLHNRYHRAQENRKSWDAGERTMEQYVDNFVRSPLAAQEISVWDNDRLLAVALCDVTPQTLSAVYHFHDPAFPQRGLGTFTLLQTLDQARQLGKTYVHMGYYIAESRSMSYKARFRPCEILTERGWERLSDD